MCLTAVTAGAACLKKRYIETRRETRHLQDKLASIAIYRQEDKTISRESYKNEVDAIARMMEAKYKIRFDSNVHIPARYFQNEHVAISIRNHHYSLSIEVESKDVKKAEKERIERAKNVLTLSPNEGADLL